MNDAALVRRRQAACNLDGVLDRFARGQAVLTGCARRRNAIQALAQRFALEEFGDDVRRARLP